MTEENYNLGFIHHNPESVIPVKNVSEDKRFLSTLISNLPGYVYRCEEHDGKWCTNFVSNGILDLTGFKAAEFLSEKPLSYGDLVLKEDQEIVRKTVQKSINEKSPYQITYRIKTADGSIKWVWEQGRGVYNKDGKLLATEGFITDISEKKNIEDEIIKKNHELAILNQIGQALSKLAKSDEIINTIFQMSGKLFDTSNLYIGLYDKDLNEISFPIYCIDGKEVSVSSRVFSKGITEYVIKNKIPLFLIKDTMKRLNDMEIEAQGKECKSILAVPMMIGDTAIGVITIQDYEHENAYSVSQIELLTTIASQAAVSLENAKLYDKVHSELTFRKKTEIELLKSLQEKELLLKEIHHRVKNNLQVMSSLLRLQSRYIKDQTILDIFKESENRIQSMAIVHSKLYSAKDYENIDFADYVKSLISNIVSTYAMLSSRIHIKHEIEKILFNIDTTIPLGLIINELISNAIKYAFPDHEGEILIKLTHFENNSYELVIKDNGKGIPEEMMQGKSDSLGLKLVTLLTGQIGGNIIINNEKGTEFKIQFNELKYPERTST